MGGNLISLADRTQRERNEIASLGGIESGRQRRRRRDMVALCGLMLDGGLSSDQEAADGGLTAQVAQDTLGGLSGAQEPPIAAGDIDTRIITALLTSKDVTEASRRACVSRTTIYNKLKDEAFSARLEAERAALGEAVRERLSDLIADGAADAIRALRDIATDRGAGFDFLGGTSASDRIAAADRLLALFAAD